MSDPVELCLIDGSSYLYRAFHALPSLTSGDGRPTGAVFGVANMIRRLVQEHQPKRLAVIFDAPGKNFRHERFPDYKAHRPPMPDALVAQVEPLHGLIDALGIRRVSVPGVEADDVIATLTRIATERRLPVLISSGDKDLAQLVSDSVILEDSLQGRRLDPAGVREKFGVAPDQIADLLALTGDASDNIPGVEKVGPKTAAKWLGQHGDLAGIIDNCGEIGGKIGENLRSSIDQLALSRSLVALDDRVELDFGLDELKPRPVDRERLRGLLKDFGFLTWLRDFDRGDVAQNEPPEARTHGDLSVSLVTSHRQLSELVDRLAAAELISFDTETTSLEPLDAELVGFAFAVQTGKAWYVPLAHHDQATEFDRDQAIRALRGVLEDPARPKLGQHLKYDLNVLDRSGIALAGIRHDTMLQSYCLNPTTTRHDLDSLATRYLQRTTTSFEELAGKGKAQLRFDQVDTDRAADYAGEDAEVCLALHQYFWPRLRETEGPCRVYQELEIPLIEVLARMERTGVALDAEALKAQSVELSERLAELEQQAWDQAGGEFNLASPKQLQEVLFDRLGLPARRKTPTGQPSTAEDVLAELALEFVLPRLILEHRSLAKLKSTYTDRLPEKIRPDTGRVHTHYHQAVTATGRLSSSDPNLQNIPIRTREGRRIRQAFVAPPGRVLLAADYSQIELRIMAHLSGDERLLAAFEAGEDVHRATAAEVFSVALEAVTPDQRRAAKAINFGLMYGMSAWGLARQLETDRDSAAAYIERYFERYPGVRRFMDRTRDLARERGYVETLDGRRLFLAEIGTRNLQRRQAAERAAINAPLQGTAADIIKRAMIEIDRWIQAAQISARLVMQVHDELVLEVDQEALEKVRDGVISRMAGAATLQVDLVVEAGFGTDWDRAH